jgi:undecaprenyl-diphosphatase
VGPAAAEGVSSVEYFHAIALGIIQGIAELFPISSAAHTLLISALLKWPLPSLPFVVMLHLGTFLAVLMYFAKDYWRIVVGFFQGFQNKFQAPDQQLSLMVLGGTFPVFVVGKAGEHVFDKLFGMPLFAAAFLLVTGIVLFVIERMPEKVKEETPDLNPPDARMWYPEVSLPQPHPGAAGLVWWKALLIGLSQVGGLFPGGSRSGFSIAAGMWAGLSREEASRFSFLLAGPAIVGASAFEALRIFKPNTAGPSDTTQHGIANLAAAPEPILVIATGFIVAFIAGWFAIRFFMRYVNDHKLTPFAYYCWAFGLVMIAVLLTRHA